MTRRRTPGTEPEAENPDAATPATDASTPAGRAAKRKARSTRRDDAKADTKARRDAKAEARSEARAKAKAKRTGRAKTEKPARDRKRDPERTKARILKAATECFTQVGLNGASLDDISKKAGVNRGLIYHYFKTKDFLFDQVLARPLAKYVQSHLDFLNQREFNAESLREVTSGFFYYLRDNPDMLRLIAWTLAMKRIQLDIAHLEFTRALYERAIERIEEAKANGLMRANVNAPHLLITIIDLCVSWHLSRAEWVEKLSWSDRETEELDEERLESILDLLTAAVQPLPTQVEG